MQKGSNGVWGRRLWQSPRLRAACGSRGSMSWEPHILVQLHSGVEATGSCWHNPHQTNHLKRPNGWQKGEEGDLLSSPSSSLSHAEGFCFPSIYKLTTSVWERQGLFARSLYRKGVELVPRFSPMGFPINRNFTLLNLCLIETKRNWKELTHLFFFFLTLRVINTNVKLFYTVTEVIEEGKLGYYILHMKCIVFL